MHIKDTILIEVAKSDWLKKASKTIAPLLHEDLKQHLLLILCEMPEEKLVKLQNDGYLKLFCIKIMWSQSTQPRQEFFNLYKPIGLYDIQEINVKFEDTLYQVLDKEEKHRLIEKVVSKNHWYEREIFNRWASGESARSIHRQTKIALREVLRVIKSIKEQIKNEYNN